MSIGTKTGNMYKAAVDTWSPFRGCSYDCTYCEKSFKAQAKRQLHICEKCYDYAPHEHPERLAESLPRTGFGQFIFACSSGDIAFCGTPFLQQVADRCMELADRTFLFQSKNPVTFNRVKWPRNVILGTTLETNRDELAKAVSTAPPPSQRVKDFLAVKHPTKMITMEPVMDFDMPVMLDWVKAIAPVMVWMGYESHGTALVEPTLDKFKALHFELATRGYMVALKTVRQAMGCKMPIVTDVPAQIESIPVHETIPLQSDVSAQIWTPEYCKAWAKGAKHHVLAAIRVLAGSEPKTTEELNAAANCTSGGAIVGGLNAWATRHGLPFPVVKSRIDGKARYRFGQEEVRQIFVEVLAG